MLDAAASLFFLFALSLSLSLSLSLWLTQSLTHSFFLSLSLSLSLPPSPLFHFWCWCTTLSHHTAANAVLLSFLSLTTKQNMHLMHKNESLPEFLSFSFAFSFSLRVTGCGWAISLCSHFPAFPFSFSSNLHLRFYWKTKEERRKAISPIKWVSSFSPSLSPSLSPSHIHLTAPACENVESYWCWNESFRLIRGYNNIWNIQWTK